MKRRTQRKPIALMVLMAFVLTMVMPTGGAWAVDPPDKSKPAAIVVTLSPQNAYTNLVAGETMADLTFKVTGLGLDKNGAVLPAEVTIIFPSELKAGTVSDPATLKNNSITMPVTYEGQMVTVGGITPTNKDKLLNATVQFQMVADKKAIQGSSMVVKTSPAPLDWTDSKTGATCKKNSVLTVEKNVYQVSADDIGAKPPIEAVATLTMQDAYGNLTNAVKAGDSLYIWLGTGVNQGIIPATITSSDCTLVEQPTGSGYYEITAIKTGTMSFKITTKVPGGDYKLYVAQGTAGSSSTIITPQYQKAEKLDLTLIKLIVSNFKNVTTHVSENNKGTINIEVPTISASDQVAIKLPDQFKSDRTELEIKEPIRDASGEIVNDAEGNPTYKLVKVVPIQSGADKINLIQVPAVGQKTYTNKTATKELEQFVLYINGKPYNPTNYDNDSQQPCQIKVEAASMKVAVSNYLAFRHDFSVTAVPDEIVFLVGDLSKSSTNIYVYLPKKTVAGVGSPVQPKAGGNVTDATIDGKDYWRVQINNVEGDKVRIPIEATSDKPAANARYDQTMAIKLEAKSSGGGLFETGAVDLRYRITDQIVDVDKSEIAKAETQKETIDKDGKITYLTKTEVTLKDSQATDCTTLNGRNLYVWIEKATNPGKEPIKGQFDVQSLDPQIQTINTELGESEGAQIGSRNVFQLRNRQINPGDPISDELVLGKIPLQISSTVSGRFVIKMAVGDSASAAIASPTIKSSEAFDFIALADLPKILLENKGTIYDRDPFGSIRFLITNLTLAENETAKIIFPAEINGRGLKTGDPKQDSFTVNNSHKTTNGYEGTIKLTDTPAAGDDAIITDQPPLLMPLNQFKFEAQGVSDPTAKFDGAITITHRNPGAQIDLALVKPAEVGGKIQILPATATDVTVTAKDNRTVASTPPTDIFDAKSMAVWITTADGKTIIKDAFTGAGADGKYLASSPLTVVNKIVTLPLKMTIAKEGDYILHMEILKPTVADPTKSERYTYTTKLITVAKEAVVEKAWAFKPLSVNDKTLTGNASNVYTAEKQPVAKPITLKTTLVDANGAVLAGKKVTASADDSKLTLTPVPADGKTGTDGTITFTGIPPDVKTYTVTLKALDADGKTVKQTATVQIPVVKEEDVNPGGNKDVKTLKVVQVTDLVAVDDRASAYLEAYDKNGDLIKVTSDTMANEIITKVRFSYTPTHSELRSGDITVRREGEGIEICFTTDRVGDYKVVAEAGSIDSATLNFEAIYQGKVTTMELDYPEDTLGIGKTSSLATLYTYDKEGVKVQKSLRNNRLTLYATGSAVESFTDLGAVTVRNNDHYVGNTIKVVVTDSYLGLIAEYEFNVSESSSGGDKDDGGITTGSKNIVLWDNYGGVQVSNRFEFYLGNESGFRTVLEPGQLSSGNGSSVRVSVVSKPANATVDASIYNNGRTLEDSGYGYLDLYCNKEGTVKLDMEIKVYNPEESTGSTKRYDYYKNRVEIQIVKGITTAAEVNSGLSNTTQTTNQKHNPDISVAMFIGSPQYTVNMVQRSMDTAPYVDAGRTYVPLRVLSTSLGASVNYDDKTQIITIIYDGERVEMQIGSTQVSTTAGTYHTDMPPLIDEAGRTMIPLRTAAEALGCNVTAVSNLDGSTSGAIFSK